ncbi:hypothetical protein ES703_80900 [subsurface metagenome]
MKILRLQSQNIKRLKVIEIIPKDNVVIISGKNEQGKSSALDSIELALKATNFNKPGKQITRPIRDGQDKAQVILELDDYIVSRNWTANDKSYLKVENKEGASFKSPQALIDSFLGDLSFDPLEFARLRPGDQKDTLIRFVDLDIDLNELEEKKKALYDDRTLKGRELKTAQALVKEISAEAPDLPDKEISVSELSASLMNASQRSSLRESQSRGIDDSEKEIEQIEEEIKSHKQAIQTLSLQLPAAKKELTKRIKDLNAIPEIDTAPIQEQIDEAEAINTRIRDRNENKSNIKHAADLQFQYDTLTKKIEKLDESKAKALSNAQMPIKGLGIDEDGITFNGKPFSQIGSANQLKVSLAIAMAMNPTLKVIRISDGSLLDADNKEIIKKMAKDNGYQCWIEEVEKGGKVGFTLEDGELVAIDGNPIIKESVIEE